MTGSPLLDYARARGVDVDQVEVVPGALLPRLVEPKPTPRRPLVVDAGRVALFGLGFGLGLALAGVDRVAAVLLDHVAYRLVGL